jgi:hypothetical protein
MEYLINDMSMKYSLKQEGSLDKWLIKTAYTPILTYEKMIIRCNDGDVYYLINQLKTRLANAMRKVANEYMDTVAKGNVIFTARTKDDEGNILDSENNMSRSFEFATKCTNRFFSIPIDNQIVTWCGKSNGIDVKDLRNTLLVLSNKKDAIEEVTLFYNSMFYMFFSTGGKPEEVRTTKFLAIMNKVYKMGNSVDKNIVNIKKLLDKWLLDGSDTYKSSQRMATINSFRKALFFYFALFATKS